MIQQRNLIRNIHEICLAGNKIVCIVYNYKSYLVDKLAKILLPFIKRVPSHLSLTVLGKMLWNQNLFYSGIFILILSNTTKFSIIL